MHPGLRLSTKHSCTVVTVKDNGRVQTRYTTDITPRNEASRKRRRNDSAGSEAEDEIFAVPESRKRNSAGPFKAGTRPSIQGISCAQNQENQEFSRIQQLETEVGDLKETVEDLKKTVNDLKQSLDENMKKAALKALNELNTPKPREHNRTQQMKQSQPSPIKTQKRLTSNSNSQISSNTPTIPHEHYSTWGSPNSISGNGFLAIPYPPTPGRRTPSDTASTSEFDKYRNRNVSRSRVRESFESSQSDLDSRSKSQAELNKIPQDHEGDEESQASLPNSRSQSPADVSGANDTNNNCEDQESQQSSQTNMNNESRNGDSKESSSSASSSDENEDAANDSETEEETSQARSGPQFQNVLAMDILELQYAPETEERLRASLSPTPSEQSGHTVLLNRNESTESGPSYGAADNYEDLLTVDAREIQPDEREPNDTAESVVQNKSDNNDDPDNSENHIQPEISKNKKEAKRKAKSEKRRDFRLKKDFTCSRPDCPYEYKYQYEIERHMRTHTNDRPFRCTQCSRAYKEKHHLGRHVDKKHKKMYTSNRSKLKK